MPTANFPGLVSYPDNFDRPLPLNGIKESDLSKLNDAWTNIQHGQGMHITGRDQNKQIWNDIMTQGIERSPTFRSIILQVAGTDRNLFGTNNPIDIKLVEAQNDVRVDNYTTMNVDLVDLSNLSFDKSFTNPQQATMGEVVVHFLSERL